MTGPTGQPLRSADSWTARVRSCRAFTLVDVLVTLAVVAVLIGLMMPSLGRVRELSRQVVCRSNLRQIGLGLALYANASKDQLPYSIYVDPRQERENQIAYAPDRTMTLRLSRSTEHITGHNWDGLGLLYQTEVLPSQQIFYCPSHHGSHSFDDYAETWRRPRGEIVGNYQYRGRGPNGATRLSFIEPSRAAMSADGMQDIEDYNHIVGLNVLRADLSLFWLDDSRGLIASYVERAGEDWSGALDFDALWLQLDEPDNKVLPGH